LLTNRLLGKRQAIVDLVAELLVHVPVPLIDLALLEAKTLVKLLDFLLAPDRVLLELLGQYLVLCLIFSQSLSLLLSPLDAVSDDYAGNLKI